jgi:glycosyltransferase involved in cell wall biosynthesis
MNNIPLISFIIPVYNAELYLNKCVDSILSSNSNDIEVILVDDGSTDKSSKICDEYAKNNLIIKTVHQKNNGVASARNTGINASSGKYLFFVDNDDWIDGKQLTHVIQILKDMNIDLVINRYLIVDGQKESLGNGFIDKKYIDKKTTKEVLSYFIKNRINIMAPWEYIVKKEIIIKNNLSFKSEQTGTDDSYFSPVLFCNCSSFYLNENVIYFWRFRQDSQGKTQDSPTYVLKMVSTINSLSEFLKTTKEKHKTDYIYFSIYKNIYSLLGEYYNYSNNEKETLKNWYGNNVILIKESLKQSGLFHKILNKIFGHFNGIILGYKSAVFKGRLYFLYYKIFKLNKK